MRNSMIYCAISCCLIAFTRYWTSPSSAPPNYDGTVALPNYYSPKKWVGNFKGASAFRANRAASHGGTLWMPYSNHNRYIRNDSHLSHTLDYFARNPEWQA